VCLLKVITLSACIIFSQIRKGKTDNLFEAVVDNIDKTGPGGAATGNPPIARETNRTSSPAGSRR